ncbi:MAG: cation diffusion facilitator family transporter [Planctomycetota bacterium]
MAGSAHKIIYAALVGNALIAITKFAAALLTGSSAMLSEGIHSVVDTGNQVLLLWGLRRARKPPSERYPFGHGKEIYFWSFVVAILIFAVGAGVSLYEGIYQILHPTPIERPAINYVVLALAVVFESAAWFFAFTEFTKAKGRWGYLEAVHRGKDPSIFVVLFEDSAALVGLVVAFFGVLLSQLTGVLVFDGAASIVIGLVLGGTAAWLAYETKSLLIGESATKQVVKGIRELVGAQPDVERVNEILTMHMGPDFVLLNLSVEFRDEATAPDLEKAIARMDRQIKAAFPEVKRVFIEAESPRSCLTAPSTDRTPATLNS